MRMDISIALNGILTSERSYDQAARQIATVNTPSPQSADTLELSADAENLVALDRAKLAVQANLGFVSVQTSLQKDALNLFA